MRALVYPALMEIGGSQVNAIEMAHGVADRGHEVVLFGPGGALLTMVDDLGLEYVRAPQENRWPSLRNMIELRRLVLERGIDVVHAYEWGPCLDLAFGPHATLATPLVTTVLSMQVSGFLPDHAPLIVGTRELAEEQRSQRAIVELIEPPIDTVKHAPTYRREGARDRFGISSGEVVLAMVCRLTEDLGKLAGALDAVEVIRRAGSDSPLRLLIVGDGPGSQTVTDRAAAVNRGLGRQAVSIAGPMLDPRDAYIAADVVLGMGSSALKGMAFGKPLIVQGENGFWRVLNGASLPSFLQRGWHGTGKGQGCLELEATLNQLMRQQKAWQALGSLGRRIAVENYSLDRAVDLQLEVYRRALESPQSEFAIRKAVSMTALKFAKCQARALLDRRDLGPAVVPRPAPRERQGAAA